MLLLLPMLGCDSVKVAELQKQNQELTAKVNLLTSDSLELQDKCSKEASDYFSGSSRVRGGIQGNGWSKEPNAFFFDHYSPRLNKCFIEINTRGGEDRHFTIMIVVRDAFEGREYGSFFEQGLEPRVSRVCWVQLPSGKTKDCRSESEFQDLVKAWMEEPLEVHVAAGKDPYDVIPVIADVCFPGAQLPERARKVLKEGSITTFENHPEWTLEDGKPVQVPCETPNQRVARLREQYNY